MKDSSLHIAVSGAAGQIAYSLLLSLANGSIFGQDQPIVLQLLDIEPALGVLKGVTMELEDCALPLLQGVQVSSDPLKAFHQADYAILLGAMPRKEGMQRKDLLHMNVGIFKEQGEALDRVAKKSVRVLVVGNPANTNAMVCAHFAPSLPASQFSALTRLDQNRAVSMIAHHLHVSTTDLRNVCIWGNHSNTQFPDLAFAEQKHMNQWQPIPFSEPFFETFVKNVAHRGAAVITARKLSSAMSAAKAVCDHLRDWHLGTAPGHFTSMGVVSEGHYGVPKGIVFSYPVTISQQGEWKVVENLPISPFAQAKLDLTIQELEEERSEAMQRVRQEKNGTKH